MNENIYICEECGFRSDIQKKCCGLKMVHMEKIIKTAKKPCLGC